MRIITSNTGELLQLVGPPPKNYKHIRLLNGGIISIIGPFDKHKIWFKHNKIKIYINLITNKEVTKEEYFKIKKPNNFNKNNKDSTIKARYGKIKHNNKIMFTTLIETSRCMTKVELFSDKKLIYEVALIHKTKRNQQSVIKRLSETFIKSPDDKIINKIRNKIKSNKTIEVYKYYYGSLF